MGFPSGNFFFLIYEFTVLKQYILQMSSIFCMVYIRLYEKIVWTAMNRCSARQVHWPAAPRHPLPLLTLVPLFSPWFLPLPATVASLALSMCQVLQAPWNDGHNDRVFLPLLIKVQVHPLQGYTRTVPLMACQSAAEAFWSSLFPLTTRSQCLCACVFLCFLFLLNWRFLNQITWVERKSI